MDLGIIGTFQIVFAITVAVFLVIFIPVAIQLYKVLGNANRVLKQVNDEVAPILDQLEHTVERANTELASLDQIVRSAKETASNVRKIAQGIQRVISSPAVRYVTALAGLLVTISRLRRRRKKKNKSQANNTGFSPGWIFRRHRKSLTDLAGTITAVKRTKS